MSQTIGYQYHERAIVRCSGDLEVPDEVLLKGAGAVHEYIRTHEADAEDVEQIVCETLEEVDGSMGYSVLPKTKMPDVPSPEKPKGRIVPSRCVTPGCGSFAINDHCHGREPGVDLDLCDVCYWRKRAGGFFADPIHKALFDTLRAVDALRSLDEALCRLSQAPLICRDALMDLKNIIGAREPYQENTDLAALDAVFEAAGWDGSGFRWTTEEGDEGEDIYLVEFTTEDKTKWEIG